VPWLFSIQTIGSALAALPFLTALELFVAYGPWRLAPLGDRTQRGA
jgi:hypothetical protein